VKRWDKVTGEGRSFLPAQSDDVWLLSFTPNSKALAVASQDGSLRLWDLTTRKERVRFEGDVPLLRSLKFSPDGTVLAGSSWENTLVIWDVATGKRIMSKVDVTGPIQAVAFSPDGQVLASAGMVRVAKEKHQHTFYDPGVIILWDVRSGRPKQTWTGFRSAVECVAFTPDGKTLIAGDFDNELSFWDVATGKKRAGGKVGNDLVGSLAISPDSAVLVSATGSSDVVRFWDIASAKETGWFPSPVGRGGWPTFTRDGRTLIVSGRRVQFWDVAELRKSLRRD
jgi:WD40 repeat protein